VITIVDNLVEALEENMGLWWAIMLTWICKAHLTNLRIWTNAQRIYKLL